MDFSKYEPQMDMAPAAAMVQKPDSLVSSQILSFNDQSPAYSYAVESQPDESFRVANVGNDSLQDFFSRPIKTQSYTWNQSVAFYESFNPWSDFFSNPRVANRISNFNILRCKLHVKIVLNGNGFFYGRLLTSYLPLAPLDLITRDRGLINQDNIEASQRPHIYLDPTTNQGGELVLPFFWIYNGLSIPSGQWSNMGEVSIRELVGLNHANGATDSVTISVFVHASEVELSTPTAVDAASIVPQMAIDEYSDGLVSKPASALAKISGMLESAPVIGPYARATTMAASTIASIAKMFGYSRPTSVQPIMEFKPTYGGNMANTNLPDTSQKLAIDAKNEVTIDPRVTGLSNCDELDIVSLAKRESYLTQFPWTLTAVPEQLLFNARVTPILFDLYSVATPPEVHMIPACWATLPFKYWRGSMKFRFQIVSSNYHKGRLKIVYDPNYSKAGYSEYNVAYTYIVDIGETKDFTVECGWGNYFPYCTTYSLSGVPIPGANPNLNHGTTAFAGSENNATNGTISVYVLNDLTVPNSSIPNDVTVNVFASMCDDFEVAVPTGSYIEEYSHFPYQMSIEPQMAVDGVTETDKDNTENPSAPLIPGRDMTMAAQEFSARDKNAIIFAGEAVVSMRQLLKRYCLSRTFGSVTGATSSGTSMWTFTLPVPFMYRGYNTTGFAFPGETAVSQLAPPGTIAYAFSKMHYINWITPAFAGMRGAFRHKYSISVHNSSANPANLSYSQVTRGSAITTGVGSTEHLVLASSAPEPHRLYSYMPGTSGGGILQDLSQNNVLEVEHPYYNRNRFIPTKNTVDVAPSDAQVQTNSVSFSTGTAANSFVWITDYIAGGEDYSLYFFTSTPVVFYTGPTDFF